MSDSNYHQLLERIELDQDRKFMSSHGKEFAPHEDQLTESVVEIDPDCDVSISGPGFHRRDFDRPTPRIQRLLKALGSAGNVLFDIKRFPDA